MKPLNQMTAGELAALYILALRGIFNLYTANEIQDALERLIGNNETVNAIRNVRMAIDSQ